MTEKLDTERLGITTGANITFQYVLLVMLTGAFKIQLAREKLHI